MKRKQEHRVLSWFLFFCLHSAFAAPGNIAQQPLFLGSSVQANIFFGIDDSGSMGWETLLNKGTHSPGLASFAVNVHPPSSYTYSWSNYYQELNRIEFRRLTCHGYNTLAYNPSVLYTPWKGQNAYQQNYTHRTLNNALNNPYIDTIGFDISNHVYFTWNDLDADGEYDGPGSDTFRAPNDPSTDECGDVSSDDSNNSIHVDTLPLTLTANQEGYPNSQQNYANWYSFYRNREYVVKRAISELIWDSNQRMGLATLHNNNNVGTPVKDMTEGNHRQQLLQALGKIESNYNTPLRELLDNTGRYFDQTGSNYEHSALGFTEPSPILGVSEGGQCQRNFSVLFSDGYWNGYFYAAGNHDGDNNSEWDGNSHADSFTDTLADIAMKYYETDLAPALSNKVKQIDNVDVNTTQHLNTFSVAFGVSGHLPDNPTDRLQAFSWPNPITDTQQARIDDMRHAAWNSRGEFHNANKPLQLINSLEESLTAIETRVGTSTSVTFSSNDLKANTQLYLTEFNSEYWTGDLIAYDINIDGSIDRQIKWRASSQLNNIVHNERVVFTYNEDKKYGVPMNWHQLTDLQKNDLRMDPDGSIAEEKKGRARLVYLKGKRNFEDPGKKYFFRKRNSLLGDIIHSSPIHVGKPNAPYPDRDPFGNVSQRYSNFANENYNRKGVVYVGSNDGIVHGFDTENNGKEILAYIPAELFDDSSAHRGLHYLTDPDYIHRYYNNHSLASNDAFILNTNVNTSAQWRTLLTGGYGAGGKGIFALDITDTNFDHTMLSANKTVLWEFTDENSAYMGNSYSKPRVVLLNNQQWAVIFGNGYNSASGKAALIILFIEAGLDGTWSSTDYKVLDTGQGSATNKTGLGEITSVDLDGDFIVDRIYGGDLNGRMWAFDLSSSNQNDWQVAHSSNGIKRPLFQAPDHQAITIKAAISRGVVSSATNQPNVLVIFGTGQMLTIADPSDNRQQSLYGVWDAGVSNIKQQQLVQQNLLTNSAPGIRIMSDHAVNYNSESPIQGDLGWYFYLPQPGERLTVSPEVRLDQVFFATTIPDEDICSNNGGSGWLMALDTRNGGESSNGAFDINDDKIINTQDKIEDQYIAGIEFIQGLPVGLGFLGGSSKIFVTGTGSGDSELKGLSTEIIKDISIKPKGRLSWQELY